MDSTFTLPGHKKLIVPQGLLDPNTSNVVQIPKQLANSHTPMMVVQSRKGLVAKALPEFGDDLSTSDDQGNVQHLTAVPMSCPSGSESPPRASSPSNLLKKMQNRTGSSAGDEMSTIDNWQTPNASRATHNTTYQTAGYSRDESPGRQPQLLHYSSRVSQKKDNQPAVGKSFTIDVPNETVVNCPSTCADDSVNYRTPTNTQLAPPPRPTVRPRGRAAPSDNRTFSAPPGTRTIRRPQIEYSSPDSPGCVAACSGPLYAQSGDFISHPQASSAKPSVRGNTSVCDMHACPAPCNPRSSTMNLTQPRAPMNVTQPRAPRYSPGTPSGPEDSDDGFPEMEFVNNVIRRFEDTPPSIGTERFQRHWNFGGGFQPAFMSSPTEQYQAGECAPCTPERGYEEVSTLSSNQWETPPSLGVTKGSWYYNTIVSDPFGPSVGEEYQEQSMQPCPGGAGGGTFVRPAAAPPRGHDGTYARPADNVLFNYSRSVAAPPVQAAPRGDETFARPAENVFFDYPRPAAATPRGNSTFVRPGGSGAASCEEPCSQSSYNRSGGITSQVQQGPLRPSTRGATTAFRRQLIPGKAGGTTQFHDERIPPIRPTIPATSVCATQHCSAECNPVNATMNVTQPRAPLNVTQPRAPLNVTQPRAPLNVTQPRAPMNVTQPRAPRYSPGTPSGPDDSDDGAGIQRMEFVDNVIRRFEETPPSIGSERLERHWNYGGGFQPPFMSSPTEQYQAGECAPCTPERGYEDVSTVLSNIWETPPSLGLTKGSWYYNTIVSDPFGEFGGEGYEEQSGTLPSAIPAGTYVRPSATPRGHDGTYARPADNAFFNYSRRAPSPAPAAPGGNTTYGRPAENVFFDYSQSPAPAAARQRSPESSEPCICPNTTY